MKIKQVILLLSVMALFISGCTPDGTVNNPSQTPTKQQQTAVVDKEKEEVSAVLFVPTEDGQGVKAKTIKMTKANHTPQGVVKELLALEQKNQYSVFPKHLEIKSVKVNDGIAFVEFNEALKKEAKGGSLEEQLEVASLVNTLTEFKEIKAVQFVINAVPISSINGHLDLTEPLKRMEDQIVK